MNLAAKGLPLYLYLSIEELQTSIGLIGVSGLPHGEQQVFLRSGCIPVDRGWFEHNKCAKSSVLCVNEHVTRAIDLSLILRLKHEFAFLEDFVLCATFSWWAEYSIQLLQLCEYSCSCAAGLARTFHQKTRSLYLNVSSGYCKSLLSWW